ncbi:MAG: hopanoid biosynthesis-associated protein HpnK [Deltaproteobacteria bacterium]|nr:hopanoid biosynthesis-associated protein HpnK [Deltaproteobacteria bacterium]
MLAFSPKPPPPPPGPPHDPLRTVIFTADDFGLSPALNGAVALAHGRGLLRCASLMVTGPAAEQAVAMARDLPELCLGVHLTLIQGRSALPPGAIPHLVDSQGRFLNDPVRVGWRYYWHKGLLPEIRRELAAQIEAALATGLKIWFLNSHVNLHLHPRIFPVVAELAREYGIPGVRLPREDWRTALSLDSHGFFPKLAQGLIFAWLSRRARRLAQAAGLIHNDYLFGLLNDGRLTEDYLLGLVPRLQPGVTEIYLHPGLFADQELRRWGPCYQRQEELAALLSPRLKEALDDAGVKVSDFREVSKK